VKRNYFIVGLILLIFFVISFLTNILGPLIPDIIDSFNLSLTLAGFLPFSFFIAYGVMSIPAGILVEKYKEKRIILVAFVIAFLGALLFASLASFPAAMISLFLIGLGMAMLQVAINPLLRVAGGEEHFAFNSVLGQLIFGLASFLSPQVYTYLVQSLKSYTGGGNLLVKSLARVVPSNLPWISLYWVFTVITLIMILVITSVRMPRVELKEDERAGTRETYAGLFKNKIVILYFFGIFVYVGSEQGVANWISKFLSAYHGYNPQTVGADTVSYFWGLLTAGCLLGLLLLKIFDSRRVLIWVHQRSAHLSDHCSVWAGKSRFVCLSPGRVFCFCDVVSHLFAGPQLNRKASRLLFRHPVHGDHRRSHCPFDYRMAGGFIRSALRNDVPLSDTRLHLEHRFLGKASDHQRNFAR
jgi:FHS family L-fucose permease-like MFS transporter